MLTLVTGGSASGKSEYAENLLCGCCNAEKLYIAAMQPCGANDAEFAARVERHRALRAGKGFRTVERYVGLSGVSLAPCGGALLECLSNLCANELFSGQPGQRPEEIRAGRAGEDGGVNLESSGQRPLESRTGRAREDGVVNLESTGCGAGCGKEKSEAAELDAAGIAGESAAWRRAYGDILRGVERLCGYAEHVVVVTNEVFSDGCCYDEETLAYIRLLGALNRALARRAARVVEVVYGIPLVLKDERGTW